MQKPSQLRLHRTAAWVCLIVLLLTQAPYAAAAWQSSRIGCCASGHCTIPGHKHDNAQTKSDVPMECGHERNQKSECKMSCGGTERVAVQAALFVFPVLLMVPGLDRLEFKHQPNPTIEISRFEKPKSPPPRITSLAS